MCKTCKVILFETKSVDDSHWGSWTTQTTEKAQVRGRDPSEFNALLDFFCSVPLNGDLTTKLKNKYRSVWQKRTGSARNGATTRCQNFFFKIDGRCCFLFSAEGFYLSALIFYQDEKNKQRTGFSSGPAPWVGFLLKTCANADTLFHNWQAATATSNRVHQHKTQTFTSPFRTPALGWDPQMWSVVHGVHVSVSCECISVNTTHPDCVTPKLVCCDLCVGVCAAFGVNQGQVSARGCAPWSESTTHSCCTPHGSSPGTRWRECVSSRPPPDLNVQRETIPGDVT